MEQAKQVKGGTSNFLGGVYWQTRGTCPAEWAYKTLKTKKRQTRKLKRDKLDARKTT